MWSSRTTSRFDYSSMSKWNFSLKRLSHELPFRKTKPPLWLPGQFSVNLWMLVANTLLGLSVPSAYTRFKSLWASSCLIWEIYCLNTSASLRSFGASKAWFKGNVASPGIAKLVSSARLINAYIVICQLLELLEPIFKRSLHTFSPSLLDKVGFSFVKSSLTNRMP